ILDSMITKDEALKLQARLDGELPESEAAEVARRATGNPEAEALQAQLRGVKQAAAAGEVILRVPETREFYWSKISREIERTARAEAQVEARKVSAWTLFVRRFLPFSAVALAALVLGLLKFNGSFLPARPSSVLQEIDLASPHSG